MCQGRALYHCHFFLQNYSVRFFVCIFLAMSINSWLRKTFYKPMPISQFLPLFWRASLRFTQFFLLLHRQDERRRDVVAAKNKIKSSRICQFIKCYRSHLFRLISSSELISCFQFQIWPSGGVSNISSKFGHQESHMF